MARNVKVVISDDEGTVLGEYDLADYVHDARVNFPRDGDAALREIGKGEMVDEIAHDIGVFVSRMD